MDQDISLNDRKAITTILEQRKLEALWMGWVDKFEDKKKEKRIVLVTTDRFFSIRPGGKIAREAHLLEIQEISAPKPNEAIVLAKSFKLHFASEQADSVIDALRIAFAKVFPGIPENQRVKLEVPATRLRDVDIPAEPLGGFLTTYKSICNLHNFEPREDILYDLENFFGPSNIKEFNLREFDPIQVNDFKALFGALQYNAHYRSLVVKETALDKSMIQSISDTLKSNRSFEELTLVRLGLTKEGLTIISDSLIANKFIGLTAINISHNNVEDKGIQSLATYIGGMNRGLVRLNIASCGASKVGMTALCSALKKNVHMGNTLTFFDITNNRLEADGSSALASFLANPNQCRSLLIGNTSANLEIIIGAILRGCNELKELDLSSNKFTKKEVPSFSKYVSATVSLTSLNLRDTQMPVDALKDVLTAITSNYYLKDFSLVLSENKIGVPGSRVIASVADKLSNVVSLDLSDNDFQDEGLGILTEGLKYNTGLKKLALDRNYKPGKKAGKSNGIEGIIGLLKSECPLTTLSVAGGKGTELKLDIIPLLYALATSETLTSLDISGNAFGNKGASVLGKALQTNDALSTLVWDNNNVGHTGFIAFNLGLKRNRALKVMPLPIMDLTVAMKEVPNQKMFTDLIGKIEANLHRNQSPTSKLQKGGFDDVSQNQFAFLSSGGREEVQKLLFKIKGTGRKVSDKSNIVIEDASNQDNIMTNLFNLKDQMSATVEHEMKDKMLHFAKEAYPVYSSVKSKLVDKLVDAVRKSYGCFDEDTVKRLQTNLAFGGQDLSQEEFERAFMEATIDLNIKAGQMFHSTVTIASDYLYEKLQLQLRDISDELAAEIAEEVRKKEEASKPAPKPAPQAAKPASKPPARKAPAPPPQNKKPKGGKEEPAVHIEELPKVESNLTHMTRDRPQVARNRKPPTRKPRTES